MSGEEVNRGWLSRSAEREARRDAMSPAERIGQIVAVVIIILIALFFYENQVSGTGFFTSEFGPLESLLFYGSLLFGAVPPLLKLILGRRNMVRPVEVANAILFIIAASWFLITFPFDFSHFTSLFPEEIRPLLSWLTNSIFKIFLVLALIASIFSAVFTSALYLAVRRVLRRGPPNYQKHT